MTKQPTELVEMDSLAVAAGCLKVLAHPVRLRVVDILMRGSYAVHEIASMCDLPAHQTCEHLRLMLGHGLLSSQRKGRTVYYHIANPNLTGIMGCIRKNCSRVQSRD